MHGTAVLIGAAGVLIRGESGTGKSQLALALIARGARLIADDQAIVSNCHDRLVVSAPAATAGLLEVRGRGLVAVPFERWAVLRLVVDLAHGQEIERLPSDAELRTELCGVWLARQPVATGEPAAPAIVEAAAQTVHRRQDAWLLHSP